MTIEWKKSKCTKPYEESSNSTVMKPWHLFDAAHRHSPLLSLPVSDDDDGDDGELHTVKGYLR